MPAGGVRPHVSRVIQRFAARIASLEKLRADLEALIASVTDPDKILALAEKIIEVNDSIGRVDEQASKRKKKFSRRKKIVDKQAPIF